MPVHKRKIIGYALGGGAARGLSHIGVLKVLDEYKITPDIIAGTSIGALIGALYASGLHSGDIEQIVSQTGWKRLALPAGMTLPLSGLTQGKRIVSFLKSILGNLSFSQLKYDFACVTTDIITGQQVVLHDGSLTDAILASISIPGIFTPVVIDGRYLVDGGLVNEVPVSVCRVMGAGYVIGVNVIPEPGKIMCNPTKGRNYPACELLRIGKIRDKNELAKVSKEYSLSLQSRLVDIRNAAARFPNHEPLEHKKPPLKSSDSSSNGKDEELRIKGPSLIDILAQSLTIAEYRVAVENLKDADIAISPEVENIGFWQFTRSAQAIEAGEKAARQALQESKLTSLLAKS
jgi:NTE family protein